MGHYRPHIHMGCPYMYMGSDGPHMCMGCPRMYMGPVSVWALTYTLILLMLIEERLDYAINTHPAKQFIFKIRGQFVPFFKKSAYVALYRLFRYSKICACILPALIVVKFHVA